MIFDGSSPLGDDRPDDKLTDFERKVAAALNNPTVLIMLLNEFKDYMVQFLALNQPAVSINQILGFSQYRADYATVLTGETTTSTSYANLATTGPTLSGLADGQYLILFGCLTATGTAGAQTHLMSVNVNGAGASDTDAARGSMDSTNIALSLARGVVKTLAEGNNEIVAQYRSAAAGTATFQNRWLIALRISN